MQAEITLDPDLLDVDYESAEDMAKIDERVASLETSVGHIKGIAYVFIPILIAWGAYITVNVISIKQAIADKGVQVMAELQNPTSPQALQAALTTINAEATDAKLNNKQLNPQKVSKVSESLVRAVEKSPQIPQTWQAATALVNLRSVDFTAAQGKNLDCDRAVPFVVITGGPNPADMVGTLTVSDCTLDLDRSDLWTASKSAVHVESQGQVIANWHLVLHNVVVHYSGTPLPHVSKISFDHCILDFNVPAQPSPAGQRLMLALLNQPIGLQSYEANVEG